VQSLAYKRLALILRIFEPLLANELTEFYRSLLSNRSARAFSLFDSFSRRRAY